MVTDPLGQIEQFAQAGANSVVVHIEAAPDPTAVIARARALNLSIGVSLNPETPLESVVEYLDQIDVLNCMTVNPGWGGQPFIPEVLPKIRAARALCDDRGLSIGIAVDGGINADTARLVLDAGATVLGVGSAIFAQPDQAEAARALRALVDEYADTDEGERKY